MNDEKFVLVENYNPERNIIERRPGWLRETSQYVLLIQESLEAIDLYSYTVIPRDLIKRIIQLK